MEKLKPLEEISSPDRRNRFFVYRDRNGGFLKPTLELVHSKISAVCLNSSVPEEIRNHFAQAQNLALYSWFHYQFHVTAEFMSMITIEFALKAKLGKKSSFKHLIEQAVEQGLIKDEGFRHLDSSANRKCSYSESLIEVLPYLRNSYAHGSQDIHNDSITPLMIAADFINQLFPEEAANNSFKADA